MGGLNNMYDAEKQKLRELAWFLLPQIKCYFCKEELSGPITHIAFIAGNISFGHRRHTKVSALFTIHHLDENRDNNKPTNLVLSHTTCHKRHHQEKRQEEGAVNNVLDQGKAIHRRVDGLQPPEAKEGGESKKS